MRLKYPLLLAPLLVAMVQTSPAATNVAVIWPGPQPDGSMRLPNQWSLRPAGQSIELGDFPVSMAVHPAGGFAAVLHCGYSKHEIILVDLKGGRLMSRMPVHESFYGLTFSADGRRLFCSGAGDETIHAFEVKNGELGGEREIRLRPADERGVPMGLAVTPSGATLYAANLWNNRVTRVDLGSNRVEDLPLQAKVAATTVSSETPAEDFDTAAATKRAQAARYTANPHAGAGYGCVLDSKHQRLYVSMWGAASVAVMDLASQTEVARWPVGEHPCELALRRDGKLLYVANANDNTVTVLDTRTGRAVETLWATLYPTSPRGATPNSLALSPDEKLLFVANANINAVAVFDVSKPGRSRSLGFIPTGWYPTAVRVTPDGRSLLIANGKGNTAKANPRGPQPAPGTTRVEFIGQLFRGTLSVVPLPSRRQLEPALAAWTAEVLRCTPLRPDAGITQARPAGSPVPGRPGDPSPITHCLYIIKENRTYDQVFGDMPEGNGDPKLCLFPEKVSPNHHRLAREFVLLDNFYAESEVSADGHEWSMAAYATDFVEKTWPLNYGHRKGKFPYPAEGVFPIAAPASGYLWDRAREAGISYRSYGEFIQDPTGPGKPATTRVKALQDHFDPWYHGFDLSYPDVKRAERFIAELHRFEQEGDLPRLQILRLPNDHTHGVSAGKRTPIAFVADNDLALGQIIEAVTHSKFWPHLAVFIVEDDAQNGPDHVDAHRTLAMVISPYTRRGAVDSTLYSTTSMLRTMELILGLQPMTQFDAAATPMFNSFQAEPNLQPFTALPCNEDLKATNPTALWGAELKFDFAKEDAADDFLFNEVIWRAVKGRDVPMPAPVHAGFVFTRPGPDRD